MLEQYWPNADRVDACIAGDAESSDVSVLLAVHQPIKFITRDSFTNAEAPASEQQLLDAFLADNLPNGYLLFPITGVSGVGKSHVIRWLDAQLRRCSKRDQLHIVRIPKSASLRKVVELILEPLSDDPSFEQARSDLTRAVAEVDKDQAVVLFRGHIENALNAKYKEIESNKDYPNRNVWLGHAKGLPKLFGDAALVEHFDNEILSRVIDRAVRGLEDELEGGETSSQFVEEDLIIPEGVKLSEAAKLVKGYYERNLASSDGTSRKIAVELLNSIVDTAVGNVFDIRQSIGGITFQDIIGSIRKKFLEENKELVLLVEDYYAMTGIQDLLLRVCIQEGRREGKQVTATMRTAIAVTDGQLAGRESILMRAQREWVIGSSRLSREDVKRNVTDMIGSYLNAARFGAERLREHFDSRDEEQGLTGWLPVWKPEDQSDEEVEALDAFGYSSQGHALFPFNFNAISQLVNSKLGQADSVIFNPRQVINHILRKVLREWRQVFIAGKFPPKDFENLRPNLYLADLIREANLGSSDKDRLRSFLTVWGGNVSNKNDLAEIHPAIYKTFSLPGSDVLFDILHRPAQPSATVQVTQRPTSLEAAQQSNDNALTRPHEPLTRRFDDPQIEVMTKALEAWTNGTRLSQANARQLRTSIIKLLERAINWNELNVDAVKIQMSWLSIANAFGNPPTGFSIIVCDRHEDEDGTLRNGFIGSLRFSSNNQSWDYPEAHQDYTACAALIDRLIPQVKTIVTKKVSEEIAIISQALLHQSRIAGLAPPLRPGPGSASELLRGLLSKPVQSPNEIFEEDWAALRDRALNLDDREKLQRALLRRVASYQTTGDTPYAVDTVRLLKALSSEIDREAYTNLGKSDLDTYKLVSGMDDESLQRKLRKVVASLKSFRASVLEYGSDKFDKNGFTDDLLQTYKLLRETGCLPEDIFIGEDFQKLLEEFRNSAVSDLLKKAEAVTEAEGAKDLPKRLNALGTIDLGLIQRTLSFLSNAEKLIKGSESLVVQKEKTSSQSDPKVTAALINKLLKDLSEAELAT